MKILAEISDATVGIGEAEKLKSTYELRKSARVILVNEAGEIAIQHLQNYRFYKLPGGGVDPGESIEEALVREVREEVGCDCEILRPVGVTIEYRAKYKLLHISYCYVAKVTSPITAPTFEEAEIAAGQTNIWVSPAVVLDLVRNGERTNYESHFNIPRELAFLEEYLTTK
ncbi:NUDIX domain-containing protein [Patescibacteria group bacterium]|nr:NUDIX domain-containing protein [Patescibacteria group bacterium]